MKKGFTLAEVLITLAIIGVIAALTIPNIIQGYQKRVLATQLKKTYNQVMSAIYTSMEDESTDDARYLSLFKQQARLAAKDFFKKYLNTDRICIHDRMDRCLAEEYTSGRGDSASVDTVLESLYMRHADYVPVCGILESGATVCFANTKVLIDVNGKETPNKVGMDLFHFSLAQDGKKPNSSPSDSTTYDKVITGENCRTRNISDVNYSDCMQYVMSNGWEID